MLFSSLFVIFICFLKFYSCQDYYDVLGVSRNAVTRDIKRAYRKKAQLLHPDKNKAADAADKFKELTDAYECIVDEAKRKRYNSMGVEGCSDGNRHHGGDHPFASFFGSMFGGHEREEDDTKRGADVILDLPVSLEELYNGDFIEVVRCKSVKHPMPGTRKCNCRMEMKTQYAGPGRFHMTQEQVCSNCPNYKYERQDRHLEVEIEIGMRDGHVYPFLSEGEPHPDGDNGDLKFIITQRPHNVFQRRGDDLYTNVSIGLVDALIGFKFELTHLDGHQVVIAREQITWPGSIMRIKNEGMPNYDNNDVRGTLYVTFDIMFPRNRLLTDEEKDAVFKIFGPSQKSHMLPNYGSPKLEVKGVSSGLLQPIVYNGFISTGASKHMPNILR